MVADEKKTTWRSLDNVLKWLFADAYMYIYMRQGRESTLVRITDWLFFGS